jgi:hypothetical protein
MTIKQKVLAYLSPEPQVQEEYVDHVAHLLRRSFTVEEQNNILLQVEIKLTEMRKNDIEQKEQELLDLKLNYKILKNRLGI